MGKERDECHVPTTEGNERETSGPVKARERRDMHVMSPQLMGNERENHVTASYGDMREKMIRTP